MIKYKCAFCGAMLETDDSLSGKQEACPGCQKVNLVPLSKHDLAEQKRQRKEERQQARAQETARAYEAEQAQEAEELQAAAPPQKAPIQASMTESVLRFIGGACVAVGVAAGIICVLSGIGKGSPELALMGLILAAAGFLVGMPYFIAQLILQYLRRIANAVERHKP